MGKERFGKEKVGLARRMARAVKEAFVPGSTVKDDSLWVLFRSKEKKALRIAKEVSDVIELEFDRYDGEDFLDAYGALCMSCTPDTMEKIIKMMFKYPVYFKRNFTPEVIKWMTTIPSPKDRDFTVSAEPIKVEYIGESLLKASILTKTGPYLTARFITTKNVSDQSDIVKTEGIFEFFVEASSIFNGEWDLPGVMKYTATVAMEYDEDTALGSDMSSIMSIIRAGIEDIIVDKKLWWGYFGCDSPRVSKRSPYYTVTLGFNQNWFISDIREMTKNSKASVTYAVDEYSIQATSGGETAEDQSNFIIPGEEEEPDDSFTVTIFPPVERRKKPSEKGAITELDVSLNLDEETDGKNKNKK